MTAATLTLAIEGMTCENCARKIQRSLLNEHGIKEAHIDWPSGTGRIVVDLDATEATRVLWSRMAAFEAADAQLWCWRGLKPLYTSEKVRK